MRQTQDNQGDRRMALLIGETIARSGTFAKSDEVLGAISNFVTSQTRAALGRAPVEGYAEHYAGLVGSGIAGLDPTGAANMLNRALTTLSQGGGKGEASQFFSASIAARNGLNPIAGKLWQQNPMATVNEAFAPDSAVGKYLSQNGVVLPTGASGSFYSQTMERLNGSYSDPWLRLNAAANHLGLNESQAAALLATPAQQLGGMERRLGKLGMNLASVAGDSIGLLGQIETGDRSKLGDIADDLLGRTGKDKLTIDEAQDLKAAMAGGDDEKLRDVLATLAAQRGQVETEGSKTRDTIAGVSNALQEYASRSLPLLNDSRAALMALAGKSLGGAGPQAIREAFLDADHNERVTQLRQEFDRYTSEQGQQARTGKISPEVAQDNVRLATKQLGLDLKTEDDRHKAAVEASRKDAARERDVTDQARRRAAGELPKPAQDASVSPVRQSVGVGVSGTALDSAIRQGDGSQPVPPGIEKVSSSGAGVGGTLLNAVIRQESGGRHRDKDGQLLKSGAGAQGIAQIMPGTGRDPGYGVLPLQNDSEAEHRRFARDYLGAMLHEFHGDKSKALAAYNAGPGRVHQAIRKHGDDWLQHMPAETRNYVPSVLSREAQGTPMPEEAKTAERNAAIGREVSFAPLSGEMQLNIGLTAEARRLLDGPAAPLQTRIQSNWRMTV